MVVPIVLTMLVWHGSLGLEASTQTTAAQQPASATQTTPEQPWPPDGVIRLGATVTAPGVTSPRLIKTSKPRYTDEAKFAAIQGLVLLEAVIETDGRVGEVRVSGSLDRDFGLDEAAVKTLKTWLFVPAKKEGIPVRVLVEVEMTFTLR